MKILHLNWKGYLGGAEIFTLNLAKAQQKMGYNVCVGYLSYSDLMAMMCQENNLNCAEFHMKNGFDVYHFLKYIIFLHKTKPTIIHAHDPTPLTFLTKLFYPKCIFVRHFHGTAYGNEIWERNRTLVWNRLILKFIDHYIANSLSTKSIVINKYGKKLPISTIYNGIDISEYKPQKTKAELKKEMEIDEATWIIGSVGRLHKAKGFDLFIDVAKVLLNKCQKLKFIIVGDGEIRDELIMKVREYGIFKNFIFTGFRTDIPDLLQIFDVFVMPSRWEAFGIVLLEAMAMCVPIVAFDVDGIREVIDHDCAIIVPPFDVSIMAESILRLIADSNLKSKLIENASKKIKQFDIHNIACQFINLYKNLTHRREEYDY